MRGNKIFSIIKKAIAVFAIIVLLLLVIFVAGRYGWKLGASMPVRQLASSK